MKIKMIAPSNHLTAEQKLFFDHLRKPNPLAVERRLDEMPSSL